jgi:hypothetical protein
MQPLRLYVHEHMPVPAQARDVLIRLGMQRVSDEAARQRAQDALKGLLPGGCMRLVPVEINEDGIALNGHEIHSRSLSKHLAGCEMALVMLSSLGFKVSDDVRDAFAANRADEGVLLDAAASVAVDAGLDFLMQDAARMLRPFGMAVQTSRFSPGYADCDIANQRILLEILCDQPFGVTLTDSCMMLPEKSVMAIGGVRHA